MSKLLILDDPADVAQAAAERFVEIARSAVEERGLFSVALSGGSTPKRAYEFLSGEDYRGRVDWSKVHVFFGDERCVPPDDAESNYRMANETMFSPLSLKAENIHRINGVGDAAANARLYEDELRSFFNGALWPRFDLVLLGMGDDGHTASLFPATEVLYEERAWVAAVWVEKFKAFRITLTAPAINHAAHIILLVTGENKAARLAEALYRGRADGHLPVHLIQPAAGSIEWLVDRAAASRLQTSGSE